MANRVGGGQGARHAPVLAIGEAAARLGITPMTLRLYERKGLVLPARTSTGRRFYSRHDLELLGCVRELIAQRGLNIEGVRHLLAQIPCWRSRLCTPEERDRCEAYTAPSMPCWAYRTTACRQRGGACRDCVVYRELPGCRSIKSRLLAGKRRAKEVVPGGRRGRAA